MWIERDFLANFDIKTTLEAILLRGPRQIGKSSMLSRFNPPPKNELYLDDPTLRQQAVESPNLLLDQFGTPILIDEVQLAPPLFSAIKQAIDRDRRVRLKVGKPTQPGCYRMTGSNQYLLDQNVKESLAGRVSQFYLQGLSGAEIRRFRPTATISESLYRGGFPELWIRSEIDVIQYLNDYITTFVERDIARVAGVEKIYEFMKLVKFLAARTANLLSYESLGSDTGVAGKTIKEWVGLLERNQLILVLPTYSSNLNKRLIKMPKLFFYDLGLCIRLMGYSETSSLLFTPLGGHLFETLVVSEVAKIKLNFRKSWDLSFWRTKDKEEIDLIVEAEDRIFLIEVKLNATSAKGLPEVPSALTRTGKKIERALVVPEGQRIDSPKGWSIVPFWKLTEFLVEGN